MTEARVGGCSGAIFDLPFFKKENNLLKEYLMANFDSEPVILVKDAYIQQEQKVILENVSFEVGKGEFVYLLGRTGSGKSSLLKTLYADLEFPQGDISVAGYKLKNLAAKDVPYLRRKLGIIFQDFELFPDRSVTDNLDFVMKATGWKSRAKMKQRQSEVLMRVGLESSASKFPHQLSGGEQQRIVIARALLNEPLVLIADEPTGNLDPEVAEDILKLFLEINRSGMAVIMATHNHHLTEKYPQRILFCKDGSLKDNNGDNTALPIIET